MSNNPIKYFFLFLLVSAFGCKEDPPVVPPPPPPPPVYKDTITVTVEDVTHRSITVNVKTTVNNPKSSINLFRIYNSNETQVSEYPITVNDTSIVDDNFGNGLQLNTTYSYYTVRIDTAGERKDSSNIGEARTLDTTSHNYTWQEFIIGEMGSQLIDVWGTDENNVYACGGVTINDTVYGILHWNGTEWQPESEAGGVAIYGFSAIDIWTVGGSIFHFDGQNWNEILFQDQILVDNIPYTSVWGTSSNNIYFGSGRGKIIHWNGQSATVFANLSTQRISDVYGLSNDFILVSTSALAPPGEAFLYNGATWTRFDELSINDLYNSVYPVTKKEFYVVGEDLLSNRNGNWAESYQLGPVMQRIRGNKQTGDIVAVGHFATILHYNGSSWKEFQFQVTEYSPFEGVYITGNKIFAVGSYSSNQARIIIGTRN